MQWQRVKERLPADQQEVLIRQRSIVQLAVYVANGNAFLLKDGSLLNVDTETIQWLELVTT